MQAMDTFVPPTPASPARARRCYCGLRELGATDLTDLRRRLGMNHSELASWLFISRKSLYRYAASWRPDGTHRCLPKPCLALLYLAMHTPPFSYRVAASGLRLPLEPPLNWAG